MSIKQMKPHKDSIIPFPKERIAHGTWLNSDGGTYVGEFLDGDIHGYGTYIRADGVEYVGAWSDGSPNGRGNLFFQQEAQLNGVFKDGKFHGRGTHTHATGEKYVGEWEDNRCNGYGVFTHANGECYVGQWEDGNFHGNGTYTYPDGNEVVGEWRMGLPWATKEYERDGTLIGTHSKGKFIADDLVCENVRGADDELHGHGTANRWKKYFRAHSSGRESLKRGEQVKPRYGTYILADLRQYLEKFKGRKWYGQDTKTGRDGSVYDGNFKEGVFHGHGTYTFGKGEFEGHKCIGEFKDGAAWNATDYDPNGEVIATWVEGARQRVVIM